MEGILSLAEMRAYQRRMATWGPGLRVLGLLFCESCGVARAFVAHDAHVTHITDAECESCGFVYGRRDDPGSRRGVVGDDGVVREVVVPPKKHVPVIGEEMAATAAQAWRELVAGGRVEQLAEPLRPVPKMPNEGAEPDGSRVASFLRSQRA